MTESDWPPRYWGARTWSAFFARRNAVRKMRLLGIEYCRPVFHRLRDERLQQAIEIAERYADGVATDDERWSGLLLATELLQRDARNYARVTGDIWEAGYAIEGLLTRDIADQLPTVLGHGERLYREPEEVTRMRFGNLAAELLRNPFRPAEFSAIWRTSTAVGLAQSVCESRSFDRLPILADALEEAGCDQHDVLAHCRSEGPHVRGCWVVDLVLGKQ